MPFKEMERIAEEKDDSDDIMGGHNERVLEEEEQLAFKNPRTESR